MTSAVARGLGLDTFRIISVFRERTTGHDVGAAAVSTENLRPNAYVKLGDPGVPVVDRFETVVNGMLLWPFSLRPFTWVLLPVLFVIFYLTAFSP